MSDKTSGEQLASGFFYGLGFWLAGFCTVGLMLVFFVFILGVGKGVIEGNQPPAIEARD